MNKSTDTLTIVYEKRVVLEQMTLALEYKASLADYAR